MLRYGIIGFGGLGKVHFRNSKALCEHFGDIKLVAICDVEESALTTQQQMNISTSQTALDLSAYNLYTDAGEMLDKENLDFVVTALPTYLHEKIAVMAMDKGVHVFSEKPMAINSEQAKNMLEASKRNNVKLMIGQCVRYFPEYRYIIKLMESGEYGKIKYANFTRLSMIPKWSWQNWFQDEAKSGGVILDLHVHDLDFINYAFGKPVYVDTRSSSNFMDHDIIQTVYGYDDGKLVTATSAWGMTTRYPFTAEFTVAFEKADLEFKRDKLMLYTETEAVEIDAVAENVAYATGEAYVDEVIDFVNCIKNDTQSTINPPESSLLTVELAEAEKKSATLKKVVEI